MRTRIVATLVLALALPCVAATSPGRVAARTTPASTHRFLALGDSYTIGESVAERERWPEQLVEQLRQQQVALDRPEIIARTGWTTTELSRAIDAADPHEPYALVTLLIGVNDQFRGGNAAGYRPRFQALLQRAIHFAGGDAKHVIVVSIPDWGVTPFAAAYDHKRVAAAIDAFNAVNREESVRAGVHYVDVTPISRRVPQDPALVAADGLHPSAAMYEAWVRAMLPEARAALASPQH